MRTTYPICRMLPLRFMGFAGRGFHAGTAIGVLGLIVLMLPVGLVHGQKESPSVPTIPLQAWIHDPVIEQVKVNPDGSKIAALTLSDASKPPDVTVWDVKNLAKPPRRFAPEDSKAIWLDWVNSKKLMVVGRQKYDYRYGGKPTLWFRNKIYLVDHKGKDFHNLFRESNSLSRGGDDIIDYDLVSTLPKDPDKILVRITDSERAEQFFEVDLDRYTTRRVFRGGDSKSYYANSAGDIYLRTEVDGAGKDVHQEFYLRNSKTGEWEAHFKLFAAAREGISDVQKTADGRYFLIDNSHSEYDVIREYDPDSRKASEPVFAQEGFEMNGIVLSQTQHQYGKLIGYSRTGSRREVVYTDAVYADLQKRINAALTDYPENDIVSLSDDMSVIVIHSHGPRISGAYFLLISGKQLVPLGSEFPNLPPAQMAEMELVHYQARDGLTIPAFLTLPKIGKPPYPTIINPHGGPWARDYLRWDRWVQFLANRGYAVLQPQYRGSQGWGQTLWRAGDKEWGQKMQDDKDDGARWLVKKGIADPDRIALFGYSYGGYAAMAATVRKDSPYQCAIAGAGLSELNTFDKVTFESRFNREFQNPTVAGLSPLYQVEDANIPVYVFHGDRDQRVPVDQSRKFVAALERHKKPVEYFEIPDMWHSRPWFPQHRLAVLSSLETYLAEKCGPGGL